MLKGYCSVLPDLKMPPTPELPPLTQEEIQIVDQKIEARKNIERWIKAIYLPYLDFRARKVQSSQCLV